MIDAVITWVDGNDPRHREKRMKYASSGQLMSNDKAGETRYADLGEIFWCVASLNRYAPWLHKIYIVTDEQDPGMDSFLERNFPDGHIPVEIVDHKVLFRGYEDCLPTFNSVSIESMTWRIPGLSDCFLEFNDDLMLLAPVAPEDFFLPDGTPVVYGGRSSIIWDKFTRLLKRNSGGGKAVTTKGLQMNAAMLAGARLSYIRPAHSQKALRRDVYEEYFDAHQGVLRRNISHRFRDASQYVPTVLQYTLLDSQRRIDLRPCDGKLFFFQPKDKPGYFARKMEQLRSFKGPFACFNSIDLASEEDRKTLQEWIASKLNITL